jgi:hypothetical protein
MDTKREIEEHAATCKERRPRWGNGPWETEPDRVEFMHAGLNCLLSRNPHVGNWCGYVGVPKGHPAYGKHYDDIDVEVHGGLTFSHHCSGSICHVTESEDDLHWLGFDCAHAWDFIPAMGKIFQKEIEGMGTSYKNVYFVRRETEKLAEQLSQYVEH